MTGPFLKLAMPACLVLLWAGITPFAFAQSESINGSIRGSVTDASGSAIPGASVLVANRDTGYTREVQATPRGFMSRPPCRSAPIV